MGRQLFFGPAQCSACHIGDLFVGNAPRNNGLDAVITDQGTGGGRFKTSSLRNIAVTAPYMHDGRFTTLDAVVEHYNSGVQFSQTLDPQLRQGNQPRRLNLSTQQKASLVAFLRTLTDDAFLTDERWSDPFRGAVASETGAASESLRLDLAGPNPFRGATALRVEGASGRTGTVEAYSATGRRVAVLHDGAFTGETLRWDASDLPPGLYVLRLRVGSDLATRTLTVLR